MNLRLGWEITRVYPHVPIPAGNGRQTTRPLPIFLCTPLKNWEVLGGQGYSLRAITSSVNNIAMVLKASQSWK